MAIFKRFELTITAPAEDATVLGPQVKVAVISEAIILTGENIEEPRPVDNLKIEMTGTAAKTFNNVSGANTTFSSSDPGPKTITVTARFGSKKQSRVRQFDLAIEKEPPAINLTSPTANQIVGGPGPMFPVQVVGTAADQSKITKLGFRVDGAGFDVAVTPPASQVTLDRQLPVSGLGPHQVVVSATDEHGNQGSVTVPITTTDTGPPQLQVASHPTDRPTTVTFTPEGVEVTITGAASDPTTKVEIVEFQLDEGGLREDGWTEAKNVSGTWSVWKAVVVLPSPGVQVVAIRATDGAGNVQIQTVTFDVAIPFGLEDLALVGYLVDLLAFVRRRLREVGGPTGSIDETVLQNTFHQPYASLAAENVRAAATRRIPQVQIAIEVLRRYTNNFDQVFRYNEAAYQSLLRNLGTSYEELRLDRMADEETREKLVQRLGIPVSGLESLFLTPERMTEPELRTIFGLVDTTLPDPLAEPETIPDLLRLQLESLHASWHNADGQQRTDGPPPLPAIDPDIVGPDDFLSAAGDAFDRWTLRSAFVNERDTAIRTAREGAATLLEGFARVLEFVGDGFDLATLEQDYQDGLDIEPQLASFHLDFATFFLLARTRRLVETAVMLNAEWEDVYAAVVQAGKRSLYAEWIQDEQNASITLGPAHFRRATNAPAPRAWRAEPRTRRAWERKLDARIQQEQALRDAYAATIAATEERTLPLLRDTLIANIDRQGYPNRDPAVWLTTRLSISFQHGGQHRLSRLEQAAETLQDLLFGLRTGRQEGLAPFPIGSPAPAWEIAITPPPPGDPDGGYDEEKFDEEFAWMGSFAAWRGAMFVFAHPENHLLPTLRPAARWTSAFKTLVDAVRNNPRMTREEANARARGYVADLVAAKIIPKTFGIDLTSELTKSELRKRRERSKADLTPFVDGDRGGLKDNTPSHLRELYLHVPLLLAQALERAGEFAAAVDWYQTVYAFDLPAAERKIDFGLVAEESLRTEYRRTFGWLLAGLDPHAIANERANAHTRFVLMSLVRCLLDFADAEFTRETNESVPRARHLYLRALDLLYLLEPPPPVAHWHFDPTTTDTISDVTGNGHDAVRHGGELVQLEDGTTALSLDGDEDRVEVPGAAPLGFGKDGEDFSLAVRFFLREENTGTLRTIARKQQTVAPGEPAFRLMMNGNSDRIVARLNTTGAAAAVTSATEIPLETWTNVVCIKEGQRLKLYVQGQLEDETTFNNVAAGGVGPLFLGSDPGHPGVDALLDEVSVYNQALTPDAVIGLAGIDAFPHNPVAQALKSRAELNLAKIHDGLNIAGLERPSRESLPVGPVSTGAGGLTAPAPARRPTPYRYSALIERAKQLVAIAQQIEANYLATLEKLDVEAYTLLRAGHDLQLTRDRVELEDLRVAEADGGITLATLQQERTQVQFDTYSDWIRTGPSYYERKMLDSYRELKARRNDLAGADAALSSAQAFLTASGGGILGTGVGAGAGAAVLTTQFVLRRMFEVNRVNEAEMQAQVNSFNASFERRKDEWFLQKSLAEKDLQIGQQQITQAQTRKSIVEKERAIASVQAEQAEAVVQFLNTKFTNVELYEWMSGVLSDVYRYFLQQATATAQLAQDQLTFERQSRPVTFIQGDYWEPPSEAALAGQETDRRGLTGSARLLKDVHQLDQHAFETNQRKLQLTQTFSLAKLVPFEFQEFRETGALPFATPMILFDQDFPGQYLRLIKGVRLSVVGLIPPARGIRATLHSAGVSRVVIGNGAFTTIDVRRPAEQIAFTSPLSATGLFELQPASDLLSPFETMGVDTAWELRMPRAANPFDYTTLTDVLFTIDYTALDSPEYRQQVISELDRSTRAERAFSIQQDFPDAWYRLHHPESDGDVQLVFEVRRSDFPTNLDQLAIEHIALAFARPADESLEVSVADLKFAAEKTAGDGDSLGVAQTVEGVISTRRANGVAWRQALGSEKAPFGRWTVIVPGNEDLHTRLEEGRITDILFVISYGAQTPEWTI